MGKIFGYKAMIIKGLGWTIDGSASDIAMANVPKETGTYFFIDINTISHPPGQAWILALDQPLGYVWEDYGVKEVRNLHNIPILGKKFVRNPRHEHNI